MSDVKGGPSTPPSTPTHLSQADEFLRRVLAMPAEQARPLPVESGARRRAMNVRGV